MITDGNDDNNCIIFGLLFDNNTILLANNFLSLSLMTLVINILAMSAASLVLRRGMMMGLGSFDKPFNRSPNNDNDDNSNDNNLSLIHISEPTRPY